MSSDWIQFVFFVGLFVCLTPLLGTYIANVFSGKATIAYQTLGWLEHFSYRIGGINPEEEMTWIEYGKALLLFNFLGFITLFFLQLVQGYLPLNPQNFGAPSWELAFNTAMSFTTNTNWQSYGEKRL